MEECRKGERVNEGGTDRGLPDIGVGLPGPTGHPLGVIFLAWVSNLFLSPENHIFMIYLIMVDGSGVIKVRSKNPPHQQPQVIF
jgi:hypothetical protein